MDWLDNLEPLPAQKRERNMLHPIFTVIHVGRSTGVTVYDGHCRYPRLTLGKRQWFRMKVKSRKRQYVK